LHALRAEACIPHARPCNASGLKIVPTRLSDGKRDEIAVSRRAFTLSSAS